MNLFDFIDKIKEKRRNGSITDNDVTAFDVKRDGISYGANTKKNRYARITIALPPYICGENLRDLDQWTLKIIAVKKEEYNKIIDGE